MTGHVISRFAVVCSFSAAILLPAVSRGQGRYALELARKQMVEDEIVVAGVKNVRVI